MTPWRFEAIGTSWLVSPASGTGPADATELTDEVRHEVRALIDGFDRTWSRFRHDGSIAALRRGEAVDLGDHAPALFALFDELVAVTAGAMNPLVGAGLERLGYDPAYSLAPSGDPVPAPPWTSAKRDGTVLRLAPGTVLDVGAAGKGLLVDLVADLVTSRTGPCVVDAGGDLANRSGRSIRVALEHPDDPELAIGVAQVPDGWSICGSAVNRRAWGDDWHHVLDARTGRPVRGTAATWVVDRTTARADALATAAFLASTADLAARVPDLHCLVLADDGSSAAHDFPAEVFT